MKIGDNIRKVRKKRGLTQKELAKLLNVSEPMVSQYESKETLKLETIKKIASALGISYFELLDNEEKNILEKPDFSFFPEYEPWILYYSGVFDTYKEKSDLFYTWYRKKKQEVSNQLELLKSIQFDFNIPFHSYKEDIDNYQKGGLEDHIRYLEDLIRELDYLFNTLEEMYGSESSFKEDGIILDTVDKKRKTLLSMIHTSFKEQKEMEQARYNSMSDEEIEKEFNSFVEKLKLENEKLLKELNKIQDNNK